METEKRKCKWEHQCRRAARLVWGRGLQGVAVGSRLRLRKGAHQCRRAAWLVWGRGLQGVAVGSRLRLRKGAHLCWRTCIYHFCFCVFASCNFSGAVQVVFLQKFEIILSLQFLTVHWWDFILVVGATFSLLMTVLAAWFCRPFLTFFVPMDWALYGTFLSVLKSTTHGWHLIVSTKQPQTCDDFNECTFFFAKIIEWLIYCKKRGRDNWLFLHEHQSSHYEQILICDIELDEVTCFISWLAKAPSEKHDHITIELAEKKSRLRLKEMSRVGWAAPAAQKRRLLLLDQKLDHERIDIVSKNHALAKKAVSNITTRQQKEYQIENMFQSRTSGALKTVQHSPELA